MTDQPIAQPTVSVYSESGSSGAKPPVLKNAADFQQGKLRFQNHIDSTDPEMWCSIVDGPYVPADLSEENRLKYHNKSLPLRGINLRVDEKRMVKVDIKAYGTLKSALPMEVLRDQLEVMFAGNEEIKRMKNTLTCSRNEQMPTTRE